MIKIILLIVVFTFLFYKSNTISYEKGYYDGCIKGIDEVTNILNKVIKEANSCTTAESKNTISQMEKESE